jgi:hypothetical protein
MGSELKRKTQTLPRLPRGNTISFPRELREAISDLHTGRVLNLDSINGDASNTALLGALVELKLVVRETGKLSGQFVIRIDLQAEAARGLAATLTKLADLAEQSGSAEQS